VRVADTVGVSHHVAAPPPDPVLLAAIIDLNARYASVVDDGPLDAWPDFFLDECIYRIQPRENFDRGLPLATLAFESRGMLRDRVYGVQETLFHDPYYQRHIVSVPRILATGDDGIRCVTNYVVVRTRRNELSSVYNAGRYLDWIVATPEGLRFRERIAVFDSELIPNSLIYPI
jgi:salicylate 5-hydroxylase small subunit